MSGKITRQELSPDLSNQIDAGKYEIATQAEAIAGALNNKIMTPLTVKQATPKNVAGGFAGLDNNGKLPSSVLPTGTLMKIEEVDVSTPGAKAGYHFFDALRYKRILIKATRLFITDTAVAAGVSVRYNDMSADYTYSQIFVGGNSASDNTIQFPSGGSPRNVSDITLDIDNTHPQYRGDAIGVHYTDGSFTQTMQQGVTGTTKVQSAPINKISIYARTSSNGFTEWKSGKIEIWGELR